MSQIRARMSAVMKVLLCTCVLSATGTAYSGSYSGMARPFYYGSSLYIDITGMQMSDRPACATRHYVDLQETDPTSQVFKNKLAFLLAAWYSGQPISLTGTGTCTSEGDEVIFEVYPG